MELYKQIGDIEIHRNDDIAVIMIDGQAVIAIPRHGHGLDDFADALKELVK